MTVPVEVWAFSAQPVCGRDVKLDDVGEIVSEKLGGDDGGEGADVLAIGRV